MLLMLRMMDEGALAKLTAPLVEVLLHAPSAGCLVRACHHPCADGVGSHGAAARFHPTTDVLTPPSPTAPTGTRQPH
jgi:hypothetical protein